jgi:hypothetical protein
MPIVKHGNPVCILQIVGGAEAVFGIAAIDLPPPRKPSAALGPAAVTKRKSFLQAPPIRLGADRQAKPSGPGF